MDAELRGKGWREKLLEWVRAHEFSDRTACLFCGVLAGDLLGKALAIVIVCGLVVDGIIVVRSILRDQKEWERHDK